MQLTGIVDTYLAIGAGGLALSVLIWLLVYLVTKINPVLQQIQMDNHSYKEVIKNNTEAIREVSRSNQNVAQALSILDSSFNALVKSTERLQDKADAIEAEVIKIRESTRECNK